MKEGRKPLTTSSKNSHKLKPQKLDTPVATLRGAWRYRVILGLVGPVSVYCDWVR